MSASMGLFNTQVCWGLIYPYGRMSENYPHDFRGAIAALPTQTYDDDIHRKGSLKRRSRSICVPR